MPKLPESVRRKVLKAQQFEITEYWIYKMLAAQAEGEDQKTLERIAEGEHSHYALWCKMTGEEVKPKNLQVFFYIFLARVFGLNFGLRLLEKNEESTHDFYEALKPEELGVSKFIEEEEALEEELLQLIRKDELQYTGSVVLGLSDALVELLGVLAGLTFAFRSAKIVALAALITGIAAALSMGASEYLSTREEGGKNPRRAALYTGLTYLFVVSCLILPFFLFTSPFTALGASFFFALVIISIFTFYVAIARGISFRRKFLELAGISFGIALLNFVIGSLARRFFPLSP